MDEPINALSNMRTPMSLWRKRGKLRFIVIFTLFHLLLTVSLFLWSFSLVLGKMDNGETLTRGEALIVKISDILLWPVFIPLGRMSVLRQTLPDWSGAVILLLNSLLWAMVAMGVGLGIRWIFTKQSNRLIG